MSTRSWISVSVATATAFSLLNCGGGTFDASGSSSGGTSSSSSSSSGAAACDQSLCRPGNQCIESDGVTECRLTCDSQRGTTGCPANYSCVVENDVSFCKADKFQPELKAGQYGASCSSLQGAFAPECDQAQFFYCQYDDRNDANAYCTQYCTDDTDCTGGYYCGAANDIPSGAHAARTVGAVHKVCQPRAYCAPCEHDLDCALSNDGTKQICIGDANGKGICTKPCTTNTNCNDEARCTKLDDQTSVCYPIAGVCVGDGNLCSPCHSDADCTVGPGACVKSHYGTEQSCSVPSGVKCNIPQDGTGTPVFDCPKTVPPGTAKGAFVSCVGQIYSEVPKDQCTGLVPIGTSSNDSGDQVGCYSRPRK